MRIEERRKGKEDHRYGTMNICIDATNCVWILVWKSSVLYGFEYGICLVLV